MKRKYKILLIVILLAYPVYKGLRELFWVTRESYMLTNELRIKIAIDPGIVAYQDLNTEKRVTLTNIKTNVKLKFKYTSLERSLFFFIDSSGDKQTITIVDQFVGQNIYDISTLRLLSNVDSFVKFGGDGGCNDECLENLGKPDLIYDYTGFHN